MEAHVTARSKKQKASITLLYVFDTYIGNNVFNVSADSRAPSIQAWFVLIASPQIYRLGEGLCALFDVD